MIFRTLALLASLCFAAAPALAQEPLPRPKLMAAMGLLATEEETVRHPTAPDFTITLPSSERVRVRRPENLPQSDDFVAAWEFLSEEGRPVEWLTITRASVDLADPETRRFAMANLLVLKSFAELARQYPGARLLGFGPIQRPDELIGTQMIGNTQTEGGTPYVFRHVGLMAEGQTDALVAIININPEYLPIRNENELADTYASWAIESLRLTGDDAPPSETD